MHRCLLIALIGLQLLVSGCGDKVSAERIAHAGGGFNGLTYTNSIDALNHNRENYNLFELDFMFTSDQELVCIHDWEGSSSTAFGKKFDIPPTHKEFLQLVQNSPVYKNCTAKSLKAWLAANPGKRIVTDVKDGNLQALSHIARYFPGYKDRFIPQIYKPEEYLPARDLGFREIIFTLYRFNGDDNEVVKNAGTHDFYAITMPPHRVRSLAPRLKELGMRTYVHTINTKEELLKFKDLGITEIYTDWLPRGR